VRTSSSRGTRYPPRYVRVRVRSFRPNPFDFSNVFVIARAPSERVRSPMRSPIRRPRRHSEPFSPLGTLGPRGDRCFRRQSNAPRHIPGRLISLTRSTEQSKQNKRGRSVCDFSNNSSPSG